MARTVRNSRVDSRDARLQLPIRPEPHWVKISQGCYLGYRKISGRSGTWIARFRDRLTKQIYKSLGPADDVLDADAATALNFEQAQIKARAWFQSVAARDSSIPLGGTFTVAQAMDRYLTYVEAHKKSHRHLKTNINAYIRPRLGKYDCADLTSATIRRWHEAIANEPPRLRAKKGEEPRYREEDEDAQEAKRKRQLRANRHLTTLKAALNLAWRDGLIAHRDVWSRVLAFRGVERQRSRILNHDEAIRLINTCESGLRELVQAALLTGARYGEIGALQARDFQVFSGSLHVRTSKSGKSRHIYLTDEGIRFFQAQAAGKTPLAPLIPMADGQVWRRDLYFRPFKAALVRAGIEKEFTFHELRHTWASLAIMAGAPLMVVAQNLGHRDTRMVELHYGHLAASFVRETIKATAPTFGFQVNTNVVGLT